MRLGLVYRALRPFSSPSGSGELLSRMRERYYSSFHRCVIWWFIEMELLTNGLATLVRGLACHLVERFPLRSITIGRMLWLLTGTF